MARADGELDSGDSYSSVERRLLAPARRVLHLVLYPFVWLLAALGISPNLVSAVQVIIALSFFFTLPTAPRLTLALFILTLLLDALDGALARHTGRESAFGALFDQLCDYARESILVAALAGIGAADAALAGLYVFSYGTLNFVLFLANRFKVPVPLAVKSYVLFYPPLLVYLWSGHNWLDWGLAGSVLAAASAVLLTLVRLRKAMDH